MDPLARRVFERYAFKYAPKETKEHKVDRLTKRLREETGLSRGVAEDIADAIIRGRDVERLALQKNWPFSDGAFEGPQGSVRLQDLKSSLTPE